MHPLTGELPLLGPWNRRFRVLSFSFSSMVGILSLYPPCTPKCWIQSTKHACTCFVHSHLAQVLQVDEPLLQANVTPYGLLHPQGQRPVLTIHVDGSYLVMHAPTLGLKPRDQGFIPLQKMNHTLGAWILLVLPHLSPQHNVHPGDVQHLGCLAAASCSVA